MSVRELASPVWQTDIAIQRSRHEEINVKIRLLAWPLSSSIGWAFVPMLLVLALVSPGLLAAEQEEKLRFPGDPTEHKLVYQFNQADEAYQMAVLFSVGAMVRKWGDNISIVVVGIGPGIHILGKNPERPVSNEIKQRVSSLSQYGVEFYACGNTMKALRWEEKNLLPFVSVVEVGASALMELQEQGYSYISW